MKESFKNGLKLCLVMYMAVVTGGISMWLFLNNSPVVSIIFGIAMPIAGLVIGVSDKKGG